MTNILCETSHWWSWKLPKVKGSVTTFQGNIEVQIYIALKCRSCIITFMAKTAACKRSPKLLLLTLQNIWIDCLTVLSFCPSALPNVCPYSTGESGTVRKEPNKPACQPPSQCPLPKEPIPEKERRITVSALVLSYISPSILPSRPPYVCCVIPEKGESFRNLLWTKYMI